jgi:hypothetical protein
MNMYSAGVVTNQIVSSGSSYFNAGNVGIGTTSPAAKLDVRIDSGYSMNWGGTDAIRGALDWTSGVARVLGTSGNALSLGANGTNDYLRITTAGNVGIGTTTPGRTLSVVGDIRATGILYDSSNSAGTSGQFLMTTATGYAWTATSTLFGGNQVTGNGTNGYTARWTGANTLSTGVIIDNGTVAGVNATSSSYTFNLQGASGKAPLNIASSTGTSLMVVDQTGNVGIGTASPGAKFHVAGDGYFTDTINAVKSNSGSAFTGVNIQNTSNTGSSDASIRIANGGSSGGDPVINLSAISEQDWAIGVRNADSNKLMITTASHLGSNRILTAQTDGNIGIGTTSPVAKLSLQGTAGANALLDIASSTGTSVLRVTESGNVGIGTTNPGLSLDVNEGAIQVGGSSNTLGVSTSNKMRFGKYNSGTAPYAAYGVIQTPQNHGIAIWNEATGIIAAFGSDAANSYQSYFGGNVGIGTTSPDALLNVNSWTGTGVTGHFVNNGATNANVLSVDYIGGSTGGSGESNAIMRLTSNSSARPLLSLVPYTGTGVLVTSTGNVGIGTTTPASKLAIEGSDVRLNLSDTSGSAQSLIALQSSGATKWFTGKNASNDFIIYDNVAGRNALRVAQSGNLFLQEGVGNVGIGTTTVSAKLVVEGNTNLLGTNNDGGVATSALNVNGAFMTIGDYSGERTFSNGIGIKFNDNLVNHMSIKYTPSAARLDFGPSDTNSYLSINSGQERFSINMTSGNVGIGTTNPTEKLTVPTGNILLTDNYGLFNTYSATRDTGMYFTGGSVAFRTNNTDGRMIITSGGNVGIGTTGPATKLEVSNGIIRATDGSAVATQIGGYGTNILAGALATSDSNGIRVLTQAGAYQVIRVGGLEIASSYGNSIPTNGAYIQGNVGIGTTTPNSKLQVQTSNAGDAISIDSGSGNNGTGYLKWNIGGASQGAIRGFYDSTISVLAFYTGNSNTERMRIDNNGNVGIGTTTPVKKLQVEGDIAIGRNKQIGQGSVWGDLSAASYGTLALYEPSTGYTILNNQDYGIKFQTAGADKMTILNGGNVGIGTASPGYKLDVSGSINSQQARIYNSSATNLALVNTTSGLTHTLYSANSAANGFDGFGIYDGSAYRLVINGGNVGIGTASPGSKLEVAGKLTVSTTLSGDTVANFINLSSSGYGLRSQGGGGSSGLYLASFNDYAGNEKVRITDAGNVGIGTASPSQKLQVAGSAVIDSALTVGTSLTLGSGDLIYTNSQTIRANTSDGSDNLRVFLAGGGAVSSSQGGYVFASGNESATPGVVGLVAGDGGSIQLINGNVGIGTTSPAAKLYVYGATGAPTTFADYNLGQAHLNGTSGSANEVVKLTFSNPYSQTTTGANAAIGAQFKSDGSYLYLGTSNSYPGITNTALTINPSGNVGIGTTTPGYQLTTTNGFALNQTTPATNYVGGNLMLNRADSASEFGTSNNYDLHFRTNDTRRMTITSGGNVGIGNSAPTAPLAIGTAGVNTLPTNTKIWVSGAGSGASTAIQNRISLGVDNNQDYGAYFGAINLDGAFNQIAQFGTRVNGTDYATLNLNQGNVGIGTTTPNRQLTISNSSQTYMNLVNTATGGRDFVIGSEVLSGAGRFVIYDSSSGSDGIAFYPSVDLFVCIRSCPGFVADCYLSAVRDRLNLSFPCYVCFGSWR